jgi:D-3-phosphoglycerate dehydrogenase
VAGKIIQFINTGSTVGCVNLPEVQLPPTRNTHRVLNFHQNVPGVLRDINNILSGYNVGGQVLVTQGKVGYLIVDLDAEMSDEVKTQVAQLSASIKTRLLY